MKIKFLQLKHLYSGILAINLLLCTENLFAQGSKIWVGTWSTSPQLVETNNNPPAPGLTNNTLREVVRVSIGGDSLRVRFCNSFSTNAVTMKSVDIAVSTGTSAINSSSSKTLQFNGNSQVTMNAGSIITSDPVAFELKPRMDIAITINYGATSASITGHPGSRTTSFLLTGTSTPTTNFSSATTTEHWYNIFGIDVLAPTSSASVAILGNSITDGRGSTTNLQNRWTDILSERLVANPETQGVGILNAGIGGNCVLKDCLGPSGVSRFERDVLNQPGVKVAIIGEGVNDIGGVTSAGAATTIGDGLIAAYKKMIDAAHAKDIKVYGATIMPFKGNSYSNQYSEACRARVNEWIRTSGLFDAVIDFDKTMGSTQDPMKLESSFQNDGLHPDASGYKKMGESIDLNLFKNLGTSLVPVKKNDFNGSYAPIQCINYPNPFSDKTTIEFNLPLESHVSLKVYSVLGDEIAELAGKVYTAGQHKVEFGGPGLSEGIHFYTIKTNSYTATGKMMVQAD